MPPLRILVPVKRVIDYAVKPRVATSNTHIDTKSLKHSLNPFDEIAIEEAVRLRERKIPSFPVESIVAVSAGPAKTQDVLRTALAIGADKAIHIAVDAPPSVSNSSGAEAKGAEAISESALEPLAVAKLLHKIAVEEKANLVIMGKQSIDDDAAQTGPMLAALLDWPQATQAAEIIAPESSSEEKLQVVKEVDGGTETVRFPLPAVITTDLRLNTPRYASLPNIMKAKKKPLVKRALDEMGVDVAARLRAVRVEEPKKREGGVKVEDVGAFVGKLKELGAL